MGSSAGLDELRGAVAGVDAAVAGAAGVLAEVDVVEEWATVSRFVAADDAVELLRGLETAARRLAALQARLLGQVERAGLHHVDGHSSVRNFARHVCGLSNPTATGRAKTMRMLNDLPQVAAAVEAGRVGVDHAQLLGRVHANPRVRDAMAEAESWLVTQATGLPYREFELVVRQWERLTDEDGPEPVNTRNHDNRTASLIQDHFDLSWTLTGSYGAFQGAAMRDIFDHYLEAETLTDWDKARAEHGDHACAADLARTDGQRRADALWQIFHNAASSPPGSAGPRFVHNIVWDAATFEECLARLDSQYEQQPLTIDGYRCETLDGAQLEPIEAVTTALVSEIRRVVVNAAGVTIDLGHARRFTGNARHAVLLSNTTCIWPGCHMPATSCHIDHVWDHARGGPTNPVNGAVMCAKHNHHKQTGYSVHRDQTGTWHLYRPTGDPIP